MPGFESGERWRLGKDLLKVSKLNDTDALKASLAQFLTPASKDSRIGGEEKEEASERQNEELLGGRAETTAASRRTLSSGQACWEIHTCCSQMMSSMFQATPSPSQLIRLEARSEAFSCRM